MSGRDEVHCYAIASPMPTKPGKLSVRCAREISRSPDGRSRKPSCRSRTTATSAPSRNHFRRWYSWAIRSRLEPTKQKARMLHARLEKRPELSPPRDHQHRHDQQEQRDRRLHPLHIRVQVVADVVDHHVHIRTREAANELSKRERSDERARRFNPGRCRRSLP